MARRPARHAVDLRRARDGGEALIATRSILIAISANTAVKLGFILALGSAALSRRTALATVLLVAVGLASLAIS